MDHISTEQKLALIRQMKSKYYEDQADLSHREQILYGKKLTANPSMPDEELYHVISSKDTRSSILIRFFVACLLLLLVIIMDQGHKKIAGITSDMIFEVISADYESGITVWMENMIKNE